MATLSKCDLAVFESLSIVEIEGFDPPKTIVEGYDVTDQIAGIDPVGSANWVGNTYGIQGLLGEGFDPEKPGILWQDYEHDRDTFTVLIASDEVEGLTGILEHNGYSVLSVREIDEPECYGDGNQGTVEILKHRDGWVIAK